MLEREDITYSDNENVGVEADFNNLETSITVSLIPTTRTNKDHLVAQIIGDLSSTTQTRSMTRVIRDQGGLSQIFNDDFHTCMFACFLSQEEPNRIHQALKDPSWIEAMHEELLQFKLQKVWILVYLPHGPLSKMALLRRRIRPLLRLPEPMLADSLLPIPFWAEAVNTACYVQNRVLVTKPPNKTPYELLHGRTPSIGFKRPFGCHVTILNTLDPLSKFEGKVDEGFFVGYSVNSKAFRVFNSRTCIVQETLHSLQKTNLTLVQVFKKKLMQKTQGRKLLNNICFFLCGLLVLQIYRTKKENATFDGKEHDVEKLDSVVNLSPSSSARSGRQDDMTKKKDKGKSPIEYFIGNRDFNANFED
nr:ribonuclease H-like domain-containing protein [Tanacetum cinerariifolium]